DPGRPGAHHTPGHAVLPSAAPVRGPRSGHRSVAELRLACSDGFQSARLWARACSASSWKGPAATTRCGKKGPPPPGHRRQGWPHGWPRQILAVLGPAWDLLATSKGSFPHAVSILVSSWTATARAVFTDDGGAVPGEEPAEALPVSDHR